MPLYDYKCNKCGLEFQENLSEEDKLNPTRIFQHENCDVYVAPHAGVAECKVELVELAKNI
jgi:predicted nucleic acid-binding Zn ribbon protein